MGPDPGKPGRVVGPAAPPAAPAPAGRGPVDAEAHFRIDEHQRQIDQIKGAVHPDHVAALVHGAIAALQSTMRAELDKMMKAMAEDSETDRAVVKAILELVQELKAAHAEVTVEKHGTVTTEQGTHTMHVVETRRMNQR